MGWLGWYCTFKFPGSMTACPIPLWFIRKIIFQSNSFFRSIKITKWSIPTNNLFWKKCYLYCLAKVNLSRLFSRYDLLYIIKHKKYNNLWCKKILSGNWSAVGRKQENLIPTSSKNNHCRFIVICFPSMIHRPRCQHWKAKKDLEVSIDPSKRIKYTLSIKKSPLLLVLHPWRDKIFASEN